MTRPITIHLRASGLRWPSLCGELGLNWPWRGTRVGIRDMTATVDLDAVSLIRLSGAPVRLCPRCRDKAAEEPSQGEPEELEG